MGVYSGWSVSHTGQRRVESGSVPCPVCRKIPDVVTFSCDVCDRENICFTHRRAERSWRATGRKITIPECCSECWARQYEKKLPEIEAIRRMRRLEIVGGCVLVLLLATIGLFFVSVQLAIVADAVVAVVLVALVRLYFRVARSANTKDRHPPSATRQPPGIRNGGR